MSESAEITRSKFPLFGVWEASLGGRSVEEFSPLGNLASTSTPTFGGMAQLVEHRTVPAKVTGSTPVAPANLNI